MTPQEKARALRPLIEKASASLDDADALDGVELFPAYEVGVWYDDGKRFRYGGKLYRARIGHTTQADWEPDNTPALYEEVAEPGQGDTPENPIPYNNNMELVSGKYYAQDGVVYRCFRDTGAPVYNNLSDLVGIYVEVVA